MSWTLVRQHIPDGSFHPTMAGLAFSDASGDSWGIDAGAAYEPGNGNYKPNGAGTVMGPTTLGTLTDARVECSQAASNQFSYAILNWQDASNMYFAEWGGGNTRIYKIVAGSFTLLAGPGTDASGSNVVRFENASGQLSLYLDGVSVLGPVADATFGAGLVKCGGNGGGEEFSKFEVYQQTGGGPPVIDYFQGRTWCHVGKAKAKSFLPVNTGGAVDASGAYTSTGTALPASVTLDPDTGELACSASNLGATLGCNIHITGPGGSDDVPFDLFVLDHKPTAAYSFVPGQRIDAPTLLGICGRDPTSGDYAHAAVGFDGDPPVNVTEETFDPIEGVHGWYRVFDPELFADGSVDVDAAALATLGPGRVLATSYVRANFDGTLTPPDKEKWCSPAGDDVTGDGSPGNPFETPGRAASEIEDLTGSCDEGTVWMEDGDYDLIAGFTTAVTTPDGFLEFRSVSGDPLACRWVSVTGGYGGVTKFKTTDVGLYRIDLPVGASVRAWFHGNTVCTGFGQIDQTVTFFGGSTFGDGIYITGYPVDPATIAAGDVAAYKTAALTKHFVVQQAASGPFGLDLKRNFSSVETSKDFTFSFDTLAQNVVAHDIDATGSLFHADFTHEFGNGGDANEFLDGAIGTEAAAQAIFARNGAIDPDEPVCNYAVRNFMVRKPTGSGWNGQWIRSGSNVSFEYIALPNEALLIADDVGTPQVNHSSYWRFVKSSLAGHTFSAEMQEPDFTENHADDSGFGDDCTTGGDEDAKWTDAEADDFSDVLTSPLRGRDAAPTVLRDVLGHARAPDGDIGPFAGAPVTTARDKTYHAAAFLTVDGV